MNKQAGNAPVSS